MTLTNNNINYVSAMSFIEECSASGMVLGLDTMTKLMDKLGNPQDDLNIIHIAGTNGKGSVGAFISSILRQSGKSVGRYVSPAVFGYLEKYSIDDNIISESEFCECIGEIKLAVDNMVGQGDAHATAFEAETAAAFLYFAKKGCDYAIIEVGMGGRLDATNIIKKPVLSVLTRIGIDHIAFLGNSIEEIAAEKCGIIKEDVPVVSAAQLPEVRKIIEETAAEKKSSVRFAKPVKYNGFSDSGQSFDYGEIKNISIGMLGKYQTENAALAIEAVRAVENVDDINIKKGLKKAVWHGRFEIIKKKPLFIADGAHNIDGVNALMESIREYFPQRRIIYITGTFADKAYFETAKISGAAAEKIYTITAPGNRGLSNVEYAKAFMKYNSNVCPASLATAVRECMSEKDAVVICFGSLSFLESLKNEVANGES